ncbi:MAG: FtsX-like permease family protein [Deltaproteobacteria bacterium]|nr:FtsX-like permease family protein [Deltaproteobacteria bacterium]
MRWMERQRAFLDFTLSAILRRKGKNASLLVIYTLMVFLIASIVFFTDGLRHEAQLILQGAPEMIVQRVLAGRQTLLPLDYVEPIKGIRGVRRVNPRLWGYYYHPAAQANYTLMASDDYPYGEDTVKIGKGVLRTWGTVRGDQLYFKAFDGKILELRFVKTFSSSSELITSDVILMSGGTFRRLTGIPEGFATDLAVTIRNPRESMTIAEKVSLSLPDTRSILREDILRTYAALFDWRSGYTIVLLVGAFLAFFIFAWDKATGLSAEERSEIGILKGLGWDTSDILLLKFWEGSVISVTAFVLGVLAAYIHTFILSAPFFEHALKGWATLYPDFQVRPSVDGYQLAVLFSLTVLPYSFICLVPAWKWASSDPDLVMRQG